MLKRALAIALGCAFFFPAAAQAGAATRIWLYTPAMPPIADRDLAARPIEAAESLAKAIRADHTVTLAETPDDADVIVEVGATRRSAHSEKDPGKMIDSVTLVVTAGRTRTRLESTSSRAKDATAQVYRQLLSWIHDHSDVVDRTPAP